VGKVGVDNSSARAHEILIREWMRRTHPLSGGLMDRLRGTIVSMFGGLYLKLVNRSRVR
jgi:hypothetical protein